MTLLHLHLQELNCFTKHLFVNALQQKKQRINHHIDYYPIGIDAKGKRKCSFWKQINTRNTFRERNAISKEQ